MRKFWLVVFLLLVSILMGCQDNRTEAPKLEFVEVEFLMPDELKMAESTLLEVQISQGKDKVNDAHKVEFEIWKEGQENHEKIIAVNTGDGIYSIDKEFQDAGTFPSSHTLPREVCTRCLKSSLR